MTLEKIIMTNKVLSDVIKIIREKTPKGWILMSSNSIGEVLIICAFARSMIKKYGYPITLCVRPEHVPLVLALYPDRFSAIVPMEQELMRSFSETGFINENQFDIDMPIHLSPIHFHSDLLMRLHNLLFQRQGSSGLNMTDVFRFMMRLDWDAPIETPCMDFFQKENAVIASLGIDVAKKEHVLLQPGNNTNKPLPADFWHAIEQEYIKSGRTVIANYKGVMLMDESIRFKTSKLIQIDIMDALFLAYHSNAVVSVMNGLINSAIFLDYSKISNAPLVHGINTDKYCAHYNLLRSNWDGAFVDFPGPPSTWLGGREGISDSVKFCEWKIETALNENDYKKAASQIFELDRESPYYLCSHLENNSYNFPKPLTYKK